MSVGLNVTGPDNWELAKQAMAEPDVHIDFVEMLVENFLHLDPGDVRAEIGDLPIGIHILNSGWATRRPDGLAELSAAIRSWCNAFDVHYVSDHLLVTTDPQGRRLPVAREVDYLDCDVSERAARWQDLLGTTLLLENFASESAEGRGQADYLREICRQHGLQILFDVSNAVIAEQNGGDPWRAWAGPGHEGRLAAGHASGFRPSDLDSSLLLDTHDCPLDERSWSILHAMRQEGWLPPTMVIERERVHDAESWFADVRRMGELYD